MICGLSSIALADEGTQNTPVPAVWEKWLGLQIVSIEYRCDGNFARDRVKENTVIKAGDLYSRSRIRESIERIYYLREFSRVEVDARMTTNGVKLTFILTKQIRTKDVRLRGNQQLEEIEIANAMRLKPGQSGQEYDRSIAIMDTEAIEKLYRSLGFFDVNVSLETDIDEGKKQAEVTFAISEGKQFVVKEVIFLGTNRADIEPEYLLLNSMERTRLGKVYGGQHFLDLDAENIEKMYRERGYITTKVESAAALTDPADIKKYNGKGRRFLAENLSEKALKGGTVVIVIKIKQGKKIDIEIETVDVNGKIVRDDKIRESIAAYRMHSISDQVLHRSAEDIRDSYKSEGYYLAAVEYETLEDKIWNLDAGDAGEWELRSDGALMQLRSAKINIDAGKYQEIQIRMRTSKGSAGRLYWVTNRGRTGYRDFKLTSDNQFRDYKIDMRIFEITGRSLKGLKKENVRSDILEKLKDMKDQKFAGKEKFIDALMTAIQEREMVTLALRYARKSGYKDWSNKISQLRFASDGDMDVSRIKAKMTEESIPVVFTVTKGPLMKIKTEASILTTEGTEPKIDAKRIRKQMLSRKRHPLAFWPLKSYLPDGIFSETVFAEDLRAVIALYKSEGYSQARIAHKEVDADREKGEIKIAITIDEGVKTAVTRVIIKSDRENVLDYHETRLNLPRFAEQTVELEKDQGPFYAGYRIISIKPFQEEDTASDRSYLRSRYADKGYFAQVEVMKQFNDKHTEITITYDIKAGNQIRLDDEVEIRGNHKTKRRVIERELSKELMEKKIFNRAEVKKSWQNLLDLDFLKGVKISTEPVGGADDLHKIIIDVEERDSISVNMHLGSDSTSAFRAGLGASHINLWGTGQQASGKVQVGTEGLSFRADYTKPWLLGRSTQGVANIYRYSRLVDYLDANREEKSYTETWTGGSAGVRVKLFRINILTLGYKREIVDYVDTVRGGDETGEIGSIETAFRRDTRANPMDPKNGWLNAITLEYANRILGGNEDFAKVTMNNMYYHQLSQDAVLAIGARTGYTRVLGDTERVLAPKQFDLSDYTTPRGYRWTAEDAGNLMVNASVEIRFPIIHKRIGGVIFFDSGYVYDELSHFDITSMKSSMGLGLRLITPIGPIRLDYGWPIRYSKNRNKWPRLAFGHAF